MYRILLLLVSAMSISACDIDESMRSKSKDQASATARSVAAKYGCMGCHAVNNTVVGPAWQLVANQYKNDEQARSMLINKIKTGGNGNWNKLTGDEKMPGFKDSMSEQEIALVVDYILALKK